MQARILVVDDEQVAALTLSAILQEQGYEVATAFSGEEAVAKAPGFIPDLLVCDVFMRAMNGVDAATRITAMLAECRVLFLSGHASLSDLLNTAPERLVYSLISKPLPPLDLLNAIACMLSALSPVDDQALRTMELEAIERYANKWMLTRNRFSVRDAGTGRKARAAIHCKPETELLNRMLPDSACCGIQLQ
jgi:CheY-like chemotaxis protein